MQFRDLKIQYHFLKNDIDDAVIKVMDNCNFINGQQVKDLENNLAEFVGTKYCISCANGTDALTLCLMALEVKEGDAVFVPDFTFFSAGEVVSSIKATPIFVDVCQDTYNMDPVSLKDAIEKVNQEGLLIPKVVIPTDLFGLPYDVEKINKIAHDNNLSVLEDGAQGFGGSYKGKRACSFGDLSITSFFPVKPLGCYGDGGAIFTDDLKMKELLESFRVHGKGTFKYDNVRIGMNSRLDTIQAAILNVKLKAFMEYELKDINLIANRLMKNLENSVKIPTIKQNYSSSWAQFTIQLKNEDERNFLQTELKKKDIPSMIYYPKAMHKQLAFQGLKEYVKTPISHDLCKTVLSIPIHPYMTEKDISLIVDEIVNIIII